MAENVGDNSNYYLTILHSSHDEVSINKSRFIGYATPIKTEEEAQLFIESVRKKHWDATHNVPVYVLGKNYQVQRYSDDGEPSGTAGVPILEMLKKEGITDLCIVITRYFGGIKLGTGGLVRAYTETAKMAIEACNVVKRQLMHLLSVTYDYTSHGKIQNLLIGLEHVIVKETLFTDRVNIKLYCLPSEKDNLIDTLIENTNGQAVITAEEDETLTVLNGMNGTVVNDPSFKLVV